MRPILGTLALALLLAPAATSAGDAPGDLPVAERQVVDAIAARSGEAHALLERLVELNSATLNPPGVRAVGGLLATRLEPLGLTPEQLETTQETMRRIVARHRPHTEATVPFEAGYPPMLPTPVNRRLFTLYDRLSRDRGYGPVEAFPPAERGAADVSFAAPHAAAMGGLGAEGSGSHSPEQRVVLPTPVASARRVALLLYRLGTEGGNEPLAARPQTRWSGGRASPAGSTVSTPDRAGWIVRG